MVSKQKTRVVHSCMLDHTSPIECGFSKPNIVKLTNFSMWNSRLARHVKVPQCMVMEFSWKLQQESMGSLSFKCSIHVGIRYVPLLRRRSKNAASPMPSDLHMFWVHDDLCLGLYNGKIHGWGHSIMRSSGRALLLSHIRNLILGIPSSHPPSPPPILASP